MRLSAFLQKSSYIDNQGVIFSLTLKVYTILINHVLLIYILVTS